MTPKLTAASDDQVLRQEDRKHLLQERADDGVLTTGITFSNRGGTAEEIAQVVGNVLRLRKEGKFQTDKISA